MMLLQFASRKKHAWTFALSAPSGIVVAKIEFRESLTHLCYRPVEQWAIADHCSTA